MSAKNIQYPISDIIYSITVSQYKNRINLVMPGFLTTKILLAIKSD
jgi:hypothetical protein